MLANAKIAHLVRPLHSQSSQQETLAIAHKVYVNPFTILLDTFGETIVNSIFRKIAQACHNIL